MSSTPLQDNYSDLKKTFEYDKPKAARLAEALTEAIAVKKRLDYLAKIVKDNKKLQPFLWTTAEGVTKAIHELEDSHLENIIRHLVTNGRKVSEQITAEAESRGIEVETIKSTIRLIDSGEDGDDSMDWDD